MEVPPLTISDVCILAATVNAGDLASIERLPGDYEYLMRAPLDFDALSYGIPRLVAAGLVELPQDTNSARTIRATARAISLYPKGLGAIDAVFKLAQTLGASEDDLTADLSLGRLEGLVPSQIEAPNSASARWRAKVPPEILARARQVSDRSSRQDDDH